MSRDTEIINRRKMLQGLSGGLAVSVAGCGGFGDGSGGSGDGSGGSGDGSGELGERVPPLVLEYWSDASRTAIVEDSVPTVQQNIEERLGVSVNVKPVQTTTQISNAHDDQRTHHLGFWYHNPSPDRLDPTEMTRRFAVDWAGANGRPNPANYASCDHTTPAIEQQTSTNEDERQDLVTEAHSAMSADYGTIPLVRIIGFAAGRSDSVSLNSTGDMGITQLNPRVFIESSPSSGDSMIIGTNTATTSTRNYPTLTAVFGLAPWNNLINSPLLEYNASFELEEMLAESYEVSDGGRTITVSLRDATFHNGDPVTAEDVRFSFNQLGSNPGVYPKAGFPDYSEINAVDETTVEFNFNEPALPFISKSMPRWGIMHKQSWEEAGVVDNPGSASPDPLVGSGPFQLNNLETGQSMQLVPHDGHPVHSPDHNLIFQSYQSGQTKVQAFTAGEIDLVQNISPGAADRISQSLNEEQFTITQFRGFIPFLLYPQCPRAPTKFRPLRNAISKVIDRREINQVALDGSSEPITKSCPILDNHPFRPAEEELTTMTEEATGDREAARQVLQEAGWGWQDGELRYPADADLSPVWPEGEQPTSDNFGCLDAEGNYAE